MITGQFILGIDAKRVGINEEGRKMIIGAAYIKQNPLTGDWMISSKKMPAQTYFTRKKNEALCMAATLSHYILTGEKKPFTLKEAKATSENN